MTNNVGRSSDVLPHPIALHPRADLLLRRDGRGLHRARRIGDFGAAVAMPLLGLVVPLKILVPAWTLVGIAAGVALLGEDRKNVSWREMAKLVPGCLVGIAVGLYVFTLLDLRNAGEVARRPRPALRPLLARRHVPRRRPAEAAAGRRRGVRWLRRRHHRHRGRHHG